MNTIIPMSQYSNMFYGNQTQPQQQQQQPQINPLQVLSMYQQFSGNSLLGGSGGSGGFSGMFGGGTSAGASSGAASGGGSALGGFGSTAASIGPWAALAAAIAINEHNADGYRAEDSRQYGLDLLSSAVANQDMQQRWLPKFGLDEDSSSNKYASFALNPVGFMFDKIDLF